MSYIKATKAEEVSVDAMALLARLVGMNVAAEDIPLLAVAVRDQLASVERLEQIEVGGLEGVNPVGSYDPRWTD